MATSRGAGRRLAIEDLMSAGGIVYQAGERGPEIVLCGRAAAGLWGLPKGTPMPGETIEETARREVREETGLDVRIERKVGEIEYWFTRAEQGKRFRKRVHYFLMAAIGGSTDLHDHEYDLVRWFPAAAAQATLTYGNEAEMVRQALTMLNGATRLDGKDPGR
ncbi:MAG: NUDIX hydrolase [Chloroflexi bacterium]|nr:NUDIX hydrolase [Chloroflexota bacterium]